MKATKLFFVAIATICLASCQKEFDAPENPSEETPVAVSDEVITFTASYTENPETRSYDETGVVTWKAGEVIYIWTDKASCTSDTYSGKAAKITLADSNISEDKKTVTFDVTGLPEGATKYFAAAMDSASDVYSMGTDGSVSSNAANFLKSDNNYTHRTHIAVASCLPGEESLSFKNVLCILKWHNKNRSVTNVVVTANDGGFVTTRFSANAETAATSLINDGHRNASFTQNYCSSGDYLYIPLAPGITYEQGLTFTLYKNNTKDEANCLGTVKTGKFTTVAGEMFNLGDIIDRVEKVYTSNYEKWNDGKDFVIGGKTYNKSTNGAATLVTEDKAIDHWGNGVYFIAEGVTATCKNLGMTGSSATSIVIGDKPGVRSKLTLTGDPYANCGGGDNIVLSNLIVSPGNADTKFFRTYGNRSINVTMDDCFLNYGAAILCSDGAGEVLNELIIMNSEVCLSNMTATSHMSPMLRYASDTEGTGSSVIFKNNVVFASDTKRLCVIGNANLAAANVKYNEVVFENNSFYNVSTSTYALVNLLDVASSVVIKNNLAYVPSGNRLGFVLASESDRTNFVPKCTITTDNKINTDAHPSLSGWGVGFVVGWGTGSDGQWLNANYYIAENPFTSFDTTTGANVKKDTYSTCGATRK